jgi:hypothetical protein
MPSISLIQSGVPVLVGGAIQPWITDASGAALSEIWIEADDGVGMAPLHRLSERGPQQHGVTDRGFRLDPRTISLVFGLYAQTLSDLYNAEDQLLTWLVPTDSAMSLLYARDNGTNRQIDVHVAGPPLFGKKGSQRVFAQSGGIVYRARSALVRPVAGRRDVRRVGR